MRVRELLVDGPRSVGAGLRARRWRMLLEAFPGFAGYRVLDLGGTTTFWARAPQRPHSVTVVNLDPDELAEHEPAATALTDRSRLPSWIEHAVADACTLRCRGRYDLVVSNSLLEHVGGYARRRQLAEVVRTAAPRHWVQTPYRYFPLEPHWLFPGMQFLPLAARAAVAERWPLSHSRSRDSSEAVASVLWTELVTRTEMAHLFPDARVRFETVLGVPKSLLAVGGAAAPRWAGARRAGAAATGRAPVGGVTA